MAEANIYGSDSRTGLLSAWTWGMSRITGVIEDSAGDVLRVDAIGHPCRARDPMEFSSQPCCPVGCGASQVSSEGIGANSLGLNRLRGIFR